MLGQVYFIFQLRLPQTQARVKRTTNNMTVFICCHRKNSVWMTSQACKGIGLQKNKFKKNVLTFSISSNTPMCANLLFMCMHGVFFLSFIFGLGFHILSEHTKVWQGNTTYKKIQPFSAPVWGASTIFFIDQIARNRWWGQYQAGSLCSTRPFPRA